MEIGITLKDFSNLFDMLLTSSRATLFNTVSEVSSPKEEYLPFKNNERIWRRRIFAEFDESTADALL